MMDAVVTRGQHAPVFPRTAGHDRFRDHAQRLVALAPALTSEQRARLAALLRTTARVGGVV